MNQVGEGRAGAEDEHGKQDTNAVIGHGAWATPAATMGW